MRWKEQNEIFDIENIKENIEGAISGKKSTSSSGPDEFKKSIPTPTKINQVSPPHDNK